MPLARSRRAELRVARMPLARAAGTCPLTFAEFTLKEFERDKEGNWIDEIPDDMLRG